MAAAAARASENLRKYVSDNLNRVSTENRPTVQAVLEARPFYLSPDLGRRLQFAQMGFGQPPSTDEILSDRERTVAGLQGALAALMNAPTAKADDKDVAQARYVTLGPVIDGLRVVATGLTPDDRVIVNGLMRARPGVRVSPEMSTAAALLEREPAPSA